MGLFNFFKNKSQTDTTDHNEGLPLIPEDVFIEKEDEGNVAYTATYQGIYAIYRYLQSDFESKGYNDSLISPDDKYKQDNLKLIKYDLEIIIHQVKTYHDSMMKEIDFHIHSRSRAGLVDLVEELKTKKDDLKEHIDKVIDIEQALQSNSGLFERAVLAYQRGFTKGLASITQSSLLTKPF